MTATQSLVLAASFYRRDPRVVARELLGKKLCRRIGNKLLTGRVVECEAYLSADDSACHSARGQTSSNRSMFQPGGIAYVYPIHSRHCVNVVTEYADAGSAVLVRALEPLSGASTMIANRGREDVGEATNGPGKLCQAMEIDRRLDGHDLTLRSQLWLEHDLEIPADEVCVTRRIGVTSAIELPLRFCIRHNRFVSGPRRLRT